MAVYTITITGSFTDRVGVMANNEAEAREQALDLFDSLYSVADQTEDKFEWDKVEIIKVDEGSFLDA
jgi:hypothetical protein